MVSSSSRQGLSASMSLDASSSGVDFHGKVSTDAFNQDSSSSIQSNLMASPSSNSNLGFSERAFSAAGAAFLSAIIVNPLDVAKTRLQAQAAGVAYQNLSHTCSFETNTMLPDRRCFPSCYRSILGEPSCAPDSSRYKGTLDVFKKIIRQEGFGRLWRGTSASLALSVPTVLLPVHWLVLLVILLNLQEHVCRHLKIPLMLKSLQECGRRLLGLSPLTEARITFIAVVLMPSLLYSILSPGFNGTSQLSISPCMISSSGSHCPSASNFAMHCCAALHSFRFLWTGLGAQLARDVPFSAICWATLEPVRRQLLAMSNDRSSPVTVVGANFFAGFVAGSIAGATTCPLDVAKTRHQIEKDHVRALKMTTRQTLVEIWRDGGMKGLFMGVGARVGRAGPSVAIVVSFYEVVKYFLDTHKT